MKSSMCGSTGWAAPGQVLAACSRAATSDVAFDATDCAHIPTME